MGAAYSHGMVVFNYEWTATLVLIFFALFMLPVFLRSRIFTVPAYLEARFDRRSRWAYAGFTILTLMFIDTAGALYAGGIVISPWPSWPGPTPCSGACAPSWSPMRCRRCS
jgi:SSS family solute:Na+ symporter